MPGSFCALFAASKLLCVEAAIVVSAIVQRGAHQRRTQRQREAKARYANSRAGRHNNAERQRRFRARLLDHNPPNSKIVTDQGFAPGDPIDKLALDQSGSNDESVKHQPTDMRCYLCRQYCDPLLRSDFLPFAQRHQRYSTTQHDTIP